MSTSLAEAVDHMTLGPRGRNVILGRSLGTPAITKDGVSVAREIELKDPLENLGAQMVKEGASKTSDPEAIERLYEPQHACEGRYDEDLAHAVMTDDGAR